MPKARPCRFRICVVWGVERPGCVGVVAKDRVWALVLNLVRLESEVERPPR